MVDDLTPQGDIGSNPETAPAAPEGAAAGSNTRRLVFVILAVVALLIVAGLVAAAVFVFVLTDRVAQDIATVPGEVVETPVAVGDAEVVEPPPVELTRVFTFRDIFSPLIVPIPEPEPSEVDTLAPGVPGIPGEPGVDPDDPGVTLPPDTLFLRDIVSVDGVTAAVLYLDGQTYTLAVGGEIPGTPWRVQSISGRSVVMLYGDVQVTLSVGQGVVTAIK